MKLFLTELKFNLTPKHFTSLRCLYTPIIGPESVLLYSLLVDQNEMEEGNPSYDKISDLIETLKTTTPSFETSLKKLEAVGLIRTFEKANNTHYIFVINEPLTPLQFKENNFLFKQAMNHISESRFEKIFFASNKNPIIKDDFQEVTTKFQDIFSIHEDKVSNTLEMPIVKFANKEEAKKGLNPSQFIKHITGSKVTPVQLSMIQRVQQTGLPSASINEIIDYSNLINGKIVSRHIEVISADMIKNGYLSHDDVLKELKNAVKKKSNKEPIKTDQKLSSDNDISWNDLFDSLGGEL